MGPGVTGRKRVRNARNGRSPMKQMPVLAGLANTGRPERRALQRTALGRDRARVLIVLGGGAVAVVVLLPVAHEEALHVVARILQEQRRDRGVDAPGQPDDDTIAHRLTAVAPAPPAALRSSPATGSSGRRWPTR